jgi:hypothetical protein
MLRYFGFLQILNFSLVFSPFKDEEREPVERKHQADGTLTHEWCFRAEQCSGILRCIIPDVSYANQEGVYTS